MQSIKVPKEIQELFFEAAACRELAANHDAGFFPSLKAIYYAQKAEKARMFAWRALSAAHAAVSTGVWTFDPLTGVAAKREDPAAPKKTRKPRAPKVVQPAAPAVKQGEIK